ncbi:MAG TPA: SAM hydroxide adenosyltransferase [Xanthomonadales bacterium]|nr:SAM hydroxide adenosyltransferase [Xanthomonadales bacterium]
MFVTIINDCRDENTMGRQATRAMHLFKNVIIKTVGIGQSELEGAGNLIDMLDASEGDEGVIMVNVAPRYGRGKKWPNGTPFGYFYYGKTLIISTVAEQMLSLAKKFNIAKSLHLTDIPTVVEAMIEKGKLDPELRHRIINSQFRSYDYMPRLAKWLIEGVDIPHEEYPFDQVEDVPFAVWWVDNFGNCKTTYLPEEINFRSGGKIVTKIGELTCYDRLKDVPDSEAGLIVGSSGLGDRRFLEVVIQGGSASEKFGIGVNSRIIDN